MNKIKAWSSSAAHIPIYLLIVAKLTQYNVYSPLAFTTTFEVDFDRRGRLLRISPIVLLITDVGLSSKNVRSKTVQNQVKFFYHE